jgi:rubrerythrin
LISSIFLRYSSERRCRLRVDFRGEEIIIFDFDELEAYKIARKLEEDGIYYYSRMKEEVLKPKIRDVIQMLLDDERKHLNLLEEKIEELSNKRDVSDDEEMLLDIVDSKVMDILKNSDHVSNALCNPQEALKLGASVEKHSIAFYNSVLNNTEDESGRAAIEKLIREEEKHLEKIQELIR